MKPCILFVDDQPRVLDGLRRNLRGMRDEWEVLFANSGRVALEQLNIAPVDVIISDLRMPGMDGAQLLNEVKKGNPRVIRIILSGQTNEEAALRLTGNNHQFLSKPCDTDTLVSTVKRALAFRDLLNDKSLQSAVAGLHDLPSPSAVYDDLVQELRGPEPSIENVAKIISCDVGLTLKILKVAGSGYFGASSRISNPLQAIRLLGIEKTNALVLSHGVTSQKPVRQIRGFSLERFSQHSVACGSLAQAIMCAENLDQKAVDNAFVAGLLHDIGSLVFALNRPEQYEEVIAASMYEGVTRLAAERQKFGATHAQVGAYLVGLWGLSDNVSEAIAYHHTPLDHPSCTFGVLTAVHVAEGLTQTFRQAHLDDTLSTVIDFGYLGKVGVANRLSAWAEILRNVNSGTDQP